ncbi:MAG: ABC transporter substrate-binding protein [Deltaproteobacteria bacterium]|nr:MAG: ABC transporter substrate-binding protein [Deltaproteobacteria bacterium]
MSETKIYPKRIISLTPSLTEILFALELGHRVVGVTDSCDYPAEVKDWPHVACWFDPDLEKLFSLKPDLVLGLQTAHSLFKLKLESGGLRVILVNPVTVDEAINDINRLGKLLGEQKKAEVLAANLQARLASLDAKVSTIAQENRITVTRILDLEDNRFHVAGPLSFQYDVISRAGGQNVTCSIQEAYPKITLTRLRQWDPEIIFSCGFDLNAIPGITNKPEWQSLRAVRSGKVFVFDCALTCRTGPRIVDMVEKLFNTLYGGCDQHQL